MDLPFLSRRTALITGLGLMAAAFMTMVATVRAAGELKERIFFTSFRPVGMELYLFDSPGKEPRRLTPDPGLNYNPVFSPDGRWVVFCSERSGNPDLYALDLKSPEPPKLLMESAAMEDSPALSPNGRLLAFVGTGEGNAEIFVIPFRPQGPDPEVRAANLTRHEGGDFHPAFSPDGKRIAFSSDRDGYRESEIYLMNADGSNVKRVTHSPGWDGSPAWSRDGSWIYFYSRREKAPGIYRIKSDGSREKRIVSGSALSPGDLRARH